MSGTAAVHGVHPDDGRVGAEKKRTVWVALEDGRECDDVAADTREATKRGASWVGMAEEGEFEDL